MVTDQVGRSQAPAPDAARRKTWGSESPPGSPRSPVHSARSTPSHVSPGRPATAPSWMQGHASLHRRWARAHVRIVRSDSRGRVCWRGPAAFARQQPGDGVAAEQAPGADAEGLVHPLPSQARRPAQDGRQVGSRPRPGGGVVGVGPFQDQGRGEARVCEGPVGHGSGPRVDGSVGAPGLEPGGTPCRRAGVVRSRRGCPAPGRTILAAPTAAVKELVCCGKFGARPVGCGVEPASRCQVVR
jgi:hypothetical protein